MSNEQWGLAIGAGQLILAILLWAGLDMKTIRDKWPSLQQGKFGTSKLILVLLIGGLAFSGYGFYLANRRPKEITKIQEKEVPGPCPKGETQFQPRSVPQQTKPKTSAASSQSQQLGIVIPPGTTINATTNAPDSAAVGVNTGTVTVNPPVNPNKTVISYNCGGHGSSVGPSETALVSVRELDVSKEFEAMRAINNKAAAELNRANQAEQYSKLLDKCNQQIQATPEWLSPYLFCGLGYAMTGAKDKARDMLSRYEGKAGPAYNDDSCKQMVDYLRKSVQP